MGSGFVVLGKFRYGVKTKKYLAPWCVPDPIFPKPDGTTMDRVLRENFYEKLVTFFVTIGNQKV